MGDVISFGRRQELTPVELTERRKKQTEVCRTEQVHQIRRKLTEVNPRLKKGDPERASAALGKLLDQAQKKGLKKTQVMADAGITPNHFPQYVTFPGKKPSVRLTWSALPYVRIVQAIVKAGVCDNRSEDDVLWEVFSETSFWKSDRPEAAEEFQELASKLHLVMDGIARRHELTAFFRNVERTAAFPAPSLKSYKKEQETGPISLEEIGISFDNYCAHEWPIEFYQPSWEAETVDPGQTMPVYPSLILGSWRLRNPFFVDVTAEVLGPGGNAQTVSGRVQGQYIVQLRLCIAPIGEKREATPALYVHLGTILAPLMAAPPAPLCGGGPQADDPASLQAAAILTFPDDGWSPLKRGKSTVSGRSPADGRDITCELNIEHNAIPEPFKAYFRDIDSAIWELGFSAPGVRFLPIVGTVCEDWFGFSIHENQYQAMENPLGDRALGYAIAERSPAGPSFSGFAADTLADMIDRLLTDSEDGLDLMFEAQAERLRVAFDEARDQAKKRRQDGWQKVQARLRSSPSTEGDT